MVDIAVFLFHDEIYYLSFLINTWDAVDVAYPSGMHYAYEYLCSYVTYELNKRPGSPIVSW